jgi:hypothetical protein
MYVAFWGSSLSLSKIRIPLLCVWQKEVADAWD